MKIDSINMNVKMWLKVPKQLIKKSVPNVDISKTPEPHIYIQRSCIDKSINKKSKIIKPYIIQAA